MGKGREIGSEGEERAGLERTTGVTTPSLLEELARLASEISSRRRKGVAEGTLDDIVAVLNRARARLVRFTPTWHGTPSIEQVRARDGARWLCKEGEYRLSVYRLTVYNTGHSLDVEVMTSLHGSRHIDEDEMAAQWCPCDENGVPE